MSAEIAQLGGSVADMIAASMESLYARDAELARSTIAREREVQFRATEIDGHCFGVLMQRQTPDSGLRFVITAMRVVVDLHRIAALCVSVCERVIDLVADGDTVTPGPYRDLTKMAGVTDSMLRQAVDAFVRSDSDLGRQVIARQRIVRAHHAQSFHELVTRVTSDPECAWRATRIHSIAACVERIGICAANLAEHVVFTHWCHARVARARTTWRASTIGAGPPRRAD